MPISMDESEVGSDEDAPVVRRPERDDAYKFNKILDEKSK